MHAVLGELRLPHSSGRLGHGRPSRALTAGARGLHGDTKFAPFSVWTFAKAH